ncbi:hypothetical protein YA0599_00975 [Pseudomonas syringae]|uniref:hypothetical protein n=1 Tax=Pseudomonas syringae TaxID=317 RepID=UPI001A19871C|nr:hypothetical protein [Pseudomonas syringae]MBI6706796.1 hypothetical protein [Pseudomonas syringae]
MQMVAEKRRGSNDSYIGKIEFAYNHRSRPLGRNSKMFTNATTKHGLPVPIWLVPLRTT